MTDYLDFYRNKVVLVTGGAGAIGSNLTRRLAELGASMVVVLDDLSSSHLWMLPDLPNILFIKGDITDDAAVKRAFVDRPKVVFHLAAFFANQNSIDYPERDLAVNGLGTLKVLEYARMTRVERFVYGSSSCSIYGDHTDTALTEDRVSISPTSPYQATKMLGELYCSVFLRFHQVPTTSVRFFSAFGPPDLPGQYRNVTPNFIYWALKGQPLPVTGDGTSTRDFTFVDDLVDGVLRAGASEEAIGKAFNLAAGREVTIKHLAETVNRLTNNQAGIRWVELRRWDRRRMLGSIELSRKTFGYSPQTSFEVGVERTVAWFRENWDRVVASAAFPPGMSSAVRR